MRKNYQISGTFSEVAVDSLVDEISVLPGTQGVEVDAERGIMAVTGENLSDAQILDAAEAAGFTLGGDLAL
ncbi:copper chaperone [Corynebacterium sp. UBA2622]|uniref:copper chaperone n=1 Tax=Corynebacterium sp. UBA2622 TaxID=1946393 RepID=UPI0025B8D0B1|nr:copper chaperone [Corynebacterium sp. UBA2622]